MKIEAEDNHEILWSRAIGGPRTGKQKTSILLEKEGPMVCSTKNRIGLPK